MTARAGIAARRVSRPTCPQVRAHSWPPPLCACVPLFGSPRAPWWWRTSTENPSNRVCEVASRLGLRWALDTCLGPSLAPFGGLFFALVCLRVSVHLFRRCLHVCKWDSLQVAEAGKVTLLIDQVPARLQLGPRCSVWVTPPGTELPATRRGPPASSEESLEASAEVYCHGLVSSRGSLNLLGGGRPAPLASAWGGA